MPVGGTPLEQDEEIVKYFHDLQANYGDGNVLGILATKSRDFEHYIEKREAKVTTEESTTIEMTPTTPGPVETTDSLIYYAESELNIYFH